MSTDTGHNSTSGDGTWGLNKERLADWGYRAMHGSIVLSKQIVSAYYAQPIKYSYYSGCSTGGRQGLKEIQLYPDSFDGVLAGAPAWWTNHLQPWTTWIGKINANPNGTNPAAIPASLFPAIRAEVLRQCDPVDGLMDGIITNPYMCDFHPDALLCQGTNTTNCLTGLQLETLYTIQHDYLENATFVFPHLALGSEAQWPVLLGNPNGPASLGTQYEQYFLLDDPTWNWEDFDYSIIQQADQQDPGNATANDFDLSPFHALGGKLIQYHGLSDGLIPTGSSIYFYKHVMRALAPLGIDLSSWYRFFLVPGMQHCNFGVNDAPWYFAGEFILSSHIIMWHRTILQSQAYLSITHRLTGANQAGPLNTSLHSVPGFSDARHDALLALMAWAEQGIAPDQIIATKWLNDTPSLGVVRQRPLCPYPTVPQYTGSGSVNASDSFVCAALPFKVPVVVQGGQGGAQSVLTVTQTQTEVVSVTASVQCTGTATQAGEWGWPWQGSSTLKAWPGRPTAAGWR